MPETRTHRTVCLRTAVLFIAFVLTAPIIARAQAITATWDASPPADAVTSYQVCLGTTSGSCNIQLASVAPSQTWYSFSPSAGVLHFIAVRALNAMGPGPYSGEVSFSTPHFPLPASQTSRVGTPISPLNLGVVDPDGSQLTYTHSGLPVGLTISSTGQITGIPSATGAYTVSVFVSDGLATAERTFNWTVTATSTPLTATGLTSNRPSPQSVGTPITFTASASGGTAPYQYKWWILTGTTWTLMQDWSPSATFTWTPTTSGTAYQVGFWVRSANTTADVGDVNRFIPFVVNPSNQAPLSLTGLTSNLPSPQRVHTAITFTATASGGIAPHQFKWWVHNGASWTVVRNWSPSRTFTWTPTSPANPYRIRVWVRSAGSTADDGSVNRMVSFVITPAVSPLTVTGLTSDLASPQPAGTMIRFTASATGGTAPYQYKFWVFNGTTWVVARDWTTARTLNWRPQVPGSNYRVRVWVRSAGVTADVGTANLSVPFVITPR